MELIGNRGDATLIHWSQENCFVVFLRILHSIYRSTIGKREGRSKQMTSSHDIFVPLWTHAARYPWPITIGAIKNISYLLVLLKCTLVCESLCIQHIFYWTMHVNCTFVPCVAVTMRLLHVWLFHAWLFHMWHTANYTRCECSMPWENVVHVNKWQGYL